MRGKFLTVSMMAIMSLILSVALTACGGQVTMERVAAANSVDALLSRHKSFLTEAVISAEYDEPFSWETYLEKDFVYVPYRNNLSNLAPGELVAYLSDRNLGSGYLIASGNGEDLIFSVAFPAMSAEDYIQSVPEDYSIINTEMTPTENILNIEPDKKNGVMNISTELNGSNFQYILNYKTLEILSMEEKSVSNQQEETVIVLNVSYDAERPELAERMLRDMRESDEISNDSAKLTIVYNPGTDSEESYSYIADKKFQISPILKDNYELCYDADGQEPFLDYGVSLKDGDVILYAIPY